MSSHSLTRREFLAATSVGLPATALAQASADGAPYNAMGERIGEVTDHSATIQTRLTATPARRSDGYNFPGITRKSPQDKLPGIPPGMTVADLEGCCPGRAGRARLLYGTRADLRGAKTTSWVEVGAAADFTHHFKLDDLPAATKLYYAVEMSGGRQSRRGATGSFRTAPRGNRFARVRFCASTCQHYLTRDTATGFLSYEAMLRYGPDFHSMIGDNVYYDSEPPVATTPELARHFWHRMYSLPALVNYYRQTPCYWLKDDHDTLINDCWPGRAPGKMAPLTFADGQRIFHEQIPISTPTYRRFRWGSALEIWLSEGRDYRSPNDAPDGPQKSIWGAEQKAWLKRTLLESDAAFRILMSPTPIVGPDRENKRDNHANETFATEGREFRAWVEREKLGNFLVICGDRHWQYHSVDPANGVREFSVGPMSDEQAAGTPGENKRYHRFHRVKGGFLSVAVDGTARAPRLVFQFHDVNGKVVYEHAAQS
jgi:alkaline phosphatase D